ncbi:hypothetical protein CP532_4165 [Ophiocordyceps camponoti-leonardi (nom. inval.)]|nr:hypothetical protein CP532_4165 [Ophiocordyceps camponoti-leonardi (nom. inval.)]
MPVRISDCTAEDAPGLAAVLYADWLDPDPWTKLCYGAVDAHEQLVHLEAVLREDLTDPEYPVAFQKAQDEETAEIVGFTQLTHFNTPPNERRHVDPIPKPAGYNVPPIRDYYAKMSSARKRAMGEDPFLHLTEMYIKKPYQRHGLGTSLMAWATEYAASKKLPIYAEASEAGEAFYKHLGWKTVGKYSVDMGLYGGEGVYVEEALMKEV